MFRTVFFAVLLALLVFNLFKNPELLELVRKIINPILLIGLILGLILLCYLLINHYSEEIVEILIIIGGLVGIGLLVAGCGFGKEYLKFRKRKKLGLIKEGVKFSSFFDEKFEKERYNKLTKKQKEIEDKRANTGPKTMFLCLIAIPVLLLLTLIIFFIIGAIKYGLLNQK